MAIGLQCVHPATPISLGGHTHIRDRNQPDGRSMALENDRYMETLGWPSMGFDTDNSKNLTFRCRYLDPNRLPYEFHTSKKTNHFDAQAGEQVTQRLEDLASKFDLSYQYGVAPTTSLLLAHHNIGEPRVEPHNQQRCPHRALNQQPPGEQPRLVITKSGSLRFDIYSGPFTKNGQLTTSPFTNAFVHMPGMPAGITNQAFSALNKGGERKRGMGELEERERKAYARGHMDIRFNQWLEKMDRKELQIGGRQAGNLTLGYVTTDVRDSSSFPF